MRRRCAALARVPVVLGVVFGVALGAGCSSSSETLELSEDSADVTIAGVPPTAPPSTEYDGSGLSSDANQLIADLGAIEDETDLCVIITGDAFQPFLTGDIDTTNLVTSPSGVTQLFVAIDSIFAHIVTISPPEIQPSAAVLQDVWTRVAALASASTDNQAQVDAILAEPQVAESVQALATWAATNCGANLLAGA